MGNSQSAPRLPRGHEIAGTGDVFLTVDTTRYVAPFSESAPSCDGPDLSLVTVIQTPGDVKIIEQSWIIETVQHFETFDDVFQCAFLSAVIFATPTNQGKVEITKGARKFLEEKGTQSIRIVPYHAGNESLSQGPYVVVQNRLRAVWRIYDDKNGAFMSIIRPQSGSFVEFKLSGSDSTCPAVAVPSRLKKPTTNQPLNGLRFAVKDIFNLKGIRTSFGSKSYLNTYEPQHETAETVLQLIELGATIIGKLKLTQFGNWEEPIESTDFQAPWNPRADGFQSSGGSSSGPAAALAAYDWLDITLGSDTTGSVMRPALWGGLFALRPTFQAVPYKGIGQGVESLDSVGCFSRDLTFLRGFCDVWLDPSHLIKAPKILARDFVADLEAHLGLATSELSFQQRWDSNPPEKAGASSLGGYMNEAIEHLFYKYYQRLQTFSDDHMEKFGYPPYLSTPNVEFWDYLEGVTQEDYTEATKHLNVYREWFWKEFFDNGNSRPIFVLPIEYSAPRYRDEIPNFRRPPPGVNSLTLAPAMKAPELLVPIGESPYQSRITKREEKLPFVVGLMSSAGTDLFLVDTVLDVLRKSNRPAKVSTGRFMWPEGERNGTDVGQDKLPK